MNKAIRLSIIVLSFSFLFLVRAYEEELFYDPLNLYFQDDYLRAIPLEIDKERMILHIFFRYSTNGFISLIIIHLLFGSKKISKFSLFFLSIAFTFLTSVFLILIHHDFQGGLLLTFYVRRFLIHPLFLFVLLPTFYYHKKILNKS